MWLGLNLQQARKLPLVTLPLPLQLPMLMLGLCLTLIVLLAPLQLGHLQLQMPQQRAWNLSLVLPSMLLLLLVCLGPTVLPVVA